MKNAKALFIDCDGVLYDKENCSYHDIAIIAFGKALDAYGISRTDAGKRHNVLRKNGVHCLLNVALDLCRARDIPFRDFAATMARYTDYSRIPPDKEMLQLLKKLGQKIPIYIVTNNTWIHLFQILNRLNNGKSQHFFDLNVSPITIEDTLCDDFFHPKKEEGQFLNLCAQTGHMPSDVLVLDDTEDVCTAAKAQGLQTQQVQNPEQTKTILRSLINARTKKKRPVSVRQTRGRTGR